MSDQKQKRLPRVGRLHTIGNVASELGRVYRQARVGRINPADAVRYAQVLLGIRLCLESSEIERKIASLEQAIAAVDNVTSLRPYMPRLPRAITVTAEPNGSGGDG